MVIRVVVGGAADPLSTRHQLGAAPPCGPDAVGQRTVSSRNDRPSSQPHDLFYFDHGHLPVWPCTLLAATGFTNKQLLGSNYRPGRMTYDLRWLRLAGLIDRMPHTNRYQLTPDEFTSACSTPNL
jgi:hypothetical protein